MSLTIDTPAGQGLVTAAEIPDRAPAAATIEITAAVPTGKLVRVQITDGKFRWEFSCKPTELQTFARFQSVALREQAVWIDHFSQDSGRAERRREEWSFAVREAFQRGGAA